MRHFSPLTTNLAALAGVALLAAAAAAAYYGMRDVNETRRVERQALRLVADIKGLKASLQEAETVQRQYLLTGEAVLIARFESLRAKVRSHLADLESRVERPEQRAALPSLKSAFVDRLSVIEDAIQVRRREGAEAAVRFAFFPERIALAEEAGRLADEFETHHRRLVAERERDAESDIGFLERAMLAGIVLAVLFLGWSLQAAQRHESARQAAEVALHARSREMRLLIDAVPAMISYADTEERFLFHNRIYAQWLGIPGARIDGRTVREVLGEEAYAAVGPQLKRALAGEEVRYERQERFANGSTHDLAITYVPHRGPGGAVLGCYALLTDISELKRLERTKNEFLSMVSYELRTQATAIQGSLGLLVGSAAGSLPEAAERLVGIAYSSCERLVRLLDDILEIEKIETGELAFSLRQEDLSRLLQMAVVATAPLAAQRGVRLEPENLQLGATAHTDRDRANQLLTNLLVNAIQSSPNGSVVHVALEVRGAMSRVAVRDQGPSVAEDFRPRLFERFSQDAAVVGGSARRFGLGLAISKMLAERLGGRVGYEPAAGGGSIFWFELPVAEPGSTAQNGALER